jgi:hypothetical protein
MSDDRAKSVSRWRWILLSITLVFLWCLAISEITGSEITKDAADNLQLALNVAHHGVMSLDTTPPYRPSMMREPVPIGVIAAAVYVTDAMEGPVPHDSYFSGTRARQLKFINLFWLTLLSGCAFLATRRFTSMFSLALLAVVLVGLDFTWLVPLSIRQYVGVDNLCTDLAGAAVLTSASLLLVTGVARRSKATLLGAGACFGLAALTKASLFYVSIALLAAFALYHLFRVWRRRTTTSQPVAGLAGALAAAFFLVTFSWMYRNHVQTGYWQIAERAGSVLLYRAYIDEMTPQEALGAFVMWSEPHLGRALSRYTGFTSADLQPGGRLQRLSERFSGETQERELSAESSGRPYDALSWYRKGRAVYEAHLAECIREGYSYPSAEADLRTRNDAVHLIVQTPVKHAALMPLLMWRGAPMTFAILVVTFAYAWRCARLDVLMFVSAAGALALFYSAVSHFTPRYGYTIHAIGVIALLTLAAPAVRRLWLAAARTHPALEVVFGAPGQSVRNPDRS